MMQRVAQKLLHRSLGFISIPPSNGMRHSRVVAEISLKSFDSDIEYGAQDGINRAAKAPQDRIVGRLQDRQMEILVGRYRGAPVRPPVLHCLERRHNPPHIFGRGPSGGEGCRRRLYDGAGFLERQQ